MEAPHTPGSTLVHVADRLPSLLLDGDMIPATRLTEADLRLLPQYPARAQFRCSASGIREHAFTGPLLYDVAVSAEPAAVPDVRKDRARFLVSVTGADGHQAVLSWAEIDPDFARHPVVLAICRDGMALELCGPQLVVPHDRCGSRYVSTVTHIWIGAQRDVEVAR